MSLSASKGGVFDETDDPQGLSIAIVRHWLDTGAKKITGAALYQSLCPVARPTQLELGIGNTCGLECQHCFLGYRSSTMNETLVPLPRLFQTVTTLVEQLGTRMICLTDRDALTPKRSIPFFEHVAVLRQRYPSLKFGGVTNGLALLRYANDLQRIQLDYLDISLDGTRHEHDAFRGSGQFDRALANLRLALKHQVAERIMVAMTLTRFNDDALIRLIHQLILKEGVQWIDIGPLMAVKMQRYQLGPTDLVAFLESLSRSLEPLRLNRLVTILMELCAYCAAFLPALVDSGWLMPDQIRQDRYGHLYQHLPVNNTIKITLRPELIPEYWRHTLRITADGYVIGGCEPLTQPDYARFAIGNIQDTSIQELYAQSLAPGSPFHSMMLAYNHSPCRTKPCFAHCLGGDALLAKAVYDDYHRKDPNCTWDDYDYRHPARAPAATQKIIV